MPVDGREADAAGVVFSGMTIHLERAFGEWAGPFKPPAA